VQQDFHYEYTQCDSNGGRWRVSVPNPNTCIGGAPNPPVRGSRCGTYITYVVTVLTLVSAAEVIVLTYWRTLTPFSPVSKMT